MSTDDRYDRVSELFDQVCDLPPNQQAKFLAETCGDDLDLIREVNSLLDNDDPEWETGLAAEAGQSVMALVAELTASDAPPAQIGRFRVIRTIGKGGMGVVYEAEQDQPHRTVALKVLPPGALSAQHLKRFNREAHVLGRFRHPGIAQVYDAGVAEVRSETGHRVLQPYFAMEFIPGDPLDDYARHNELGQRDRLALMARICDAVQHAHEHGVIHRDLKPGNILVEPGGQPKVLDFGVSRATNADVHTVSLQTEVGQLIGTIPYMSPEQVAGDPDALDARSDVYSLGVVLYELLAGRLPYDLKNCPIPEAVRIIREQDPSRLSSVSRTLRGDIETLVGKALEKEKERRYQSAADLAADIRRHLTDEPLVARPASTFYQVRKFARRNKALVGGVFATMLAIVVGAGLAVRFAIQALEREQAALRAGYHASIAAAIASMELGDPREARTRLESTPEHLRGWEWRHLLARLDPVLARYAVPPADSVAIGRFVPIHRCAFRPDGVPLVAVARPDAVEVIDVLSAEATVTVAVSGATRPTLARDGSRLAAHVPSASEVRLWEVTETGAVERNSIETEGEVLLLFCGDGSKLVVGGSNHVRVFDARDGSLLAAFAISGSDYLDVSPNGERLVVSHEPPRERRIALCATDTGRILQDTHCPLDSRPILAQEPHGSTLAWATYQGSRFIRLVDPATMEEKTPLRGHSFGINGLTWSADGLQLASVSRDELILWDVGTGVPRLAWHIADLIDNPDMKADEADCTMLLAPDVSQAFIVQADTVFLVDLRDSIAPTLNGHRSFTYLATFNANGDTIASIDFTSELRLWDSNSGALLGTLPVPWYLADRRPLTVGFAGNGLGIHACMRTWTADGRWGPLIEAPTDLRETPNGIVRALGVDLPKALAILDHSVVFGPGDEWQAIGAEIVDLSSGRKLADIEGGYGKDLSPDGTRLIGGDGDGGFEVWDTASLERLAQIRGHQSYVHDVAFSPDGTRVVSASGDYTLRIWDSLPRRERAVRVRINETLRDAVRPRIDALLSEGDAVQALTRFVARDDPSPDELRASRRLLLLHGLKHTRPPALRGMPADGAGIVARYEACSSAGDALDPAGSDCVEWIWVPSPGDFRGTPCRDEMGEAAWRVQRRAPTSNSTHAWYACSLTQEVIAAANRHGWRLRARVRPTPGSTGDFDLGYVGDGRVWGLVAGNASGSKEPVHLGRTRIVVPSDGRFHDVEIVTQAGSARACVTVDGAIADDDLQPTILTSDPLRSTGQHFVRGELTNSLFFGLADGPEPGGVDIHRIEFEIQESECRECPGPPA